MDKHRKSTLAGLRVPGGASVNVKIDITAEVHVTSYSAKQKVNLFLAAKVGNLLGSDEPELYVSNKLFWRVPVILTSPSRGKIGKVGEILVDAGTGDICLEESTPLQVLRRSAESYAESSSP